LTLGKIFVFLDLQSSKVSLAHQFSNLVMWGGGGIEWLFANKTISHLLTWGSSHV
jgi:hypothetical protein